MERRKFIGTAAVGSLGIVSCKAANAPIDTLKKDFVLKNNINHSVCHWCFGKIPLEDFLKTLNELGVKSIDLTGPEEWPILKKYNIHASMCWGAGKGITEGWNDPKLHEELIADYEQIIPKVAEAGYTNLICFSGNRNGMDDKVGLKNCAEGLKKIMPLAEKHGVVLQMELLNSKINHEDYMCDTSAWGIELCKAINSESFKLLFDIYHMQIMEGDIIRTIQDNHQYFGHYHTAGVPGRNEVDESQELYYPAIMRAILATGFTGHVAQEFLPKKDDKIDSLKQGFLICDV
ncbi:TIM barrel protein [Cellulophaga sp. E16_2]|uniref:Xylose isomerase domain-containing protein TIM barrel n=1 Tax=Cellulophaga algicola (strain DSM 14237 / IC166 / ACAM 630) TaxID=688270 RepID=E6XAK0_CELAD|nr:MULTISPECIES: TIM barrel protein [Cellulophaga]ADV49916.1 Xylose isomerase domain-containing protein TIM barrel [Cellulophaga algicola DSM 14237]MBO0592298.1 TIM barrel protein [Cellulophaga sp. E16_2]